MYMGSEGAVGESASQALQKGGGLYKLYKRGVRRSRM
jgi:hypothetical protein